MRSTDIDTGEFYALKTTPGMPPVRVKVLALGQPLYKQGRNLDSPTVRYGRCGIRVETDSGGVDTVRPAEISMTWAEAMEHTDAAQERRKQAAARDKAGCEHRARIAVLLHHKMVAAGLPTTFVYAGDEEIHALLLAAGFPVDPNQSQYFASPFKSAGSFVRVGRAEVSAEVLVAVAGVKAGAESLALLT